MNARAINQILNGFADGDAISTCARAIRAAARAWGCASEIYSPLAHVAPAARGECRALEDYTGRTGDVVLHHYSIASPAVDLFLASPARKILVYHNITPATWFKGFDDDVAARLEAARARLANAVSAVDDCWAVSEFNARELRDYGARNVRVFPLIFDASLFDAPIDPDVQIRFKTKVDHVPHRRSHCAE